jgi:polar amino acid transport system substrate-binding protein
VSRHRFLSRQPPRRYRLVSTACLVLAGALGMCAQAMWAEDETVTVAVLRDAPPFSYQAEDGSWRGLAVDLWNIVAAELHRATRFEGMDRMALVDAVASGRARFGIGPISITAERLDRVDFSVPIYSTGIAIAMPYVPRGAWGVLHDAVFSSAFLKLVSGLLALLAVVGTIFWMVERHRNPDFAGQIQGWGSGIWLSIVTMTTVGYGDTAPRTLSGRVVAAIWMLVSIVLISVFTGTITTLLTIEGISPRIVGFEDLHRVRVAAVTATAAAQLMAERRISAQQFPDLVQAFSALVDRRADALVFDRALLAAALKNRPDLPITILPGTLRAEYYAVAMRSDEPLRRQINQAIAGALDSPTWSRLRFDYLGSQDETR